MVCASRIFIWTGYCLSSWYFDSLATTSTSILGMLFLLEAQHPLPITAASRLYFVGFQESAKQHKTTVPTGVLVLD